MLGGKLLTQGINQQQMNTLTQVFNETESIICKYHIGPVQT